MILISPIPGQETRNSDFLIRHNAAVMIHKLKDLKDVLEYLISNPEKMHRMKESIQKIKTPNASRDIAKLAVEIARAAGTGV